ncbi:Tm-1-like ATP-binding domain-containing protein [Sciscionella marina]|uniref:Tm-1-like ATP-binding domain-containing protein n=1 Tax=Sciscionella marina TaxID=508770 RepID=UPI0003638174|nr:Tm-1-like ATP-binding domain-containing protein [Sciscionella marina]
MTTVALLGSLDTKGEEYMFLRERLRQAGVQVVLIDSGVLEPPTVTPDIDRATVAAAAGTSIEELLAGGDRASAVGAMGEGAGTLLAAMVAEGSVDGVLALGGSGGTDTASRAMRELPLGVPKVIVSTMASGNTRGYVGTSDITMMYSVVDISGVNSVSAPILANAAAATAGMAATERPRMDGHHPVVAASMVGLTTPGGSRLCERLGEFGYESLVFHATGVGGRTLESLVEQGRVAGVAEMTPTELVDDLFGGICSAGPDRLTAAGRRGIPQVVSLGALDMINFGPMDSLPQRYRNRVIHVHNEQITLVRTDPAECAQLGGVLATKLNAARGPVSVFVPTEGLSSISVAGKPFHDTEADTALVDALLAGLRPEVTVHRAETDVNDRDLAVCMAEELHRLLRESRETAQKGST